jgi:hypothetical protein
MCGQPSSGGRPRPNDFFLEEVGKGDPYLNALIIIIIIIM